MAIGVLVPFLAALFETILSYFILHTSAFLVCRDLRRVGVVGYIKTITKVSC